ncbi:22930_t:CDS:1, partial [Dentiscutata erythropus]
RQEEILNLLKDTLERSSKKPKRLLIMGDLNINTANLPTTSSL